MGRVPFFTLPTNWGAFLFSPSPRSGEGRVGRSSCLRLFPVLARPSLRVLVDPSQLSCRRVLEDLGGRLEDSFFVAPVAAVPDEVADDREDDDDRQDDELAVQLALFSTIAAVP